MRRMYGEERHIAVLKAELENFIEDEDDGKPVDFGEDVIKTKLMYTKKSKGRAIKDKPHFRPINSDKQKKVDNETLTVRPLDKTNNTKLKIQNNTNTVDESNKENEISYKTKLESIANIEINHLDQDRVSLEAVIKQSIETNSIYSNFSPNSKNDIFVSAKNNTDRNVTTTENIMNSTDNADEQYDDVTTETEKDAWKNADTSTLPPTLLFSEHEKLKIDRIDTKETEKKEEAHSKPAQHQHQETMRPAVIKLRGA